MLSKIQKLFGIAETGLTIWAMVGGSAVLGIISGWLSTYSTWVSSFGIIGWILSGFLVTIAALMVPLICAYIHLLWRQGRALSKWEQQVDGINPLDSSFSKARIKIEDLKDPITNEITSKTITECDLIGPANIYCEYPCSFNGVKFRDCNFIPLKKGAPLHNVVTLRDFNMTKGRLLYANVFFLPSDSFFPSIDGVELVAISSTDLDK